jgi:hypothetical protein
MAILWNSRRDRSYISGGSRSRPFREHNECMRRFRLAHSKIEKIESAGTTDAPLWSTFIRVWKVIPLKFWVN